MDQTVPTNLQEDQQVAKNAVLDAGDAAEQFRQDFKAFLGQVVRPDSWRDGLKLVVDGGLGFLKDLQEMITQHNWTPDQLVKRMDADLEAIVQKHPELRTQWENVKVSFNFAKMKTDEALKHLKVQFDQSQVVSAVWSGVKGEIQKDFADLLARFTSAPASESPKR
jgi:hypothetical protein